MTRTGEKILAVMEDGQWWTDEVMAKKVKVCRKKTRSTLMGCVVAGLVEYRRTEKGAVEYRRIEENG